MSQATIPRTPTPEAWPHSDMTPYTSPDRSRNALPKLQSRPDDTITPPPSTQISSSNNKPQAKFSGRGERWLASPPPTLRIGPPITSGSLYGEVPTLEAVKTMNEEDLRQLVSELLPALGEARVTAAHSKLQHSLLSIENEESAKRAEVEHEATRREVEVLQEGTPVQQHYFSPIRSPTGSIQRNLQLALSHCRELQHENAILRKRLRSSKKLIVQVDGKNADLKENIQLLRQRIKDNREHLNELQESGAMSVHGTPQQDFSPLNLKSTPRTPATRGLLREYDFPAMTPQNSLDALLQASHVLSAETNSVPSSPNHRRQTKVHPQHMRGAHSLSSLPITPEKRPMTADTTVITPVERIDAPRVSFSAPGTQLPYEQDTRPQDDRESTISASDNEEEDNLAGSQASQMASSMLRRTLEAQDGSVSSFHRPPSANTLTQSKLYGSVKKPWQERVEASLKRNTSDAYDDTIRSSKKLKATRPGSESVGLGIKSWPSPSQ